MILTAVVWCHYRLIRNRLIRNYMATIQVPGTNWNPHFERIRCGHIYWGTSTSTWKGTRLLWYGNTAMHRTTHTYLPAHSCGCTQTMLTNQTAGSWQDIPQHRKHSSATSFPVPAMVENRVLLTQSFSKVLTGNATQLTSLQNLRSTDLPSLRTQSSMRVLMPFPHTALSLSWQVLQSAGRCFIIKNNSHVHVKYISTTHITTYLIESRLYVLLYILLPLIIACSWCCWRTSPPGMATAPSRTAGPCRE